MRAYCSGVISMRESYHVVLTRPRDRARRTRDAADLRPRCTCPGVLSPRPTPPKTRHRRVEPAELASSPLLLRYCSTNASHANTTTTATAHPRDTATENARPGTAAVASPDAASTGTPPPTRPPRRSAPVLELRSSVAPQLSPLDPLAQPPRITAAPGTGSRRGNQDRRSPAPANAPTLDWSSRASLATSLRASRQSSPH